MQLLLLQRPRFRGNSCRKSFVKVLTVNDSNIRRLQWSELLNASNAVSEADKTQWYETFKRHSNKLIDLSVNNLRFEWGNQN